MLYYTCMPHIVFYVYTICPILQSDLMQWFTFLPYLIFQLYTRCYILIIYHMVYSTYRPSISFYLCALYYIHFNQMLSFSRIGHAITHCYVCTTCMPYEIDQMLFSTFYIPHIDHNGYWGAYQCVWWPGRIGRISRVRLSRAGDRGVNSMISSNQWLIKLILIAS